MEVEKEMKSHLNTLRTLNPCHRELPGLIDHDNDDWVIFDSEPILIYLAETYNRLIPSSLQGRSETLQWLMWRKNAQVANHEEMYASLNTHLSTRKFVAADMLTIADISILAWLVFNENNSQNDQKISFDKWTHLRSWYGRINCRPAMQRGHDLGLFGWLKKSSTQVIQTRRKSATSSSRSFVDLSGNEHYEEIPHEKREKIRTKSENPLALQRQLPRNRALRSNSAFSLNDAGAFASPELRKSKSVNPRKSKLRRKKDVEKKRERSQADEIQPLSQQERVVSHPDSRPPSPDPVTQSPLTHPPEHNTHNMHNPSGSGMGAKHRVSAANLNRVSSSGHSNRVSSSGSNSKFLWGAFAGGLLIIISITVVRLFRSRPDNKSR